MIELVLDYFFEVIKVYNISTLNKISPVGLADLTDAYKVTDDISVSDAVLVRSQAMHDMEFPESLLAIARAGVGVNNIPLDRCAEEGIVVMNTPGANANGVKELVIAGMILSYRNLIDASNWAQTLTDGELTVEKQVEKGKSNFKGNEIMGKTLGIIGLGGIGVSIANAAVALGMNVTGYDPFFSAKNALRLDSRVTVVDNKMDVVPDADFLIAQVHYTPATENLIDREVITAMKDGAVLLNFARAPIVEEEAVFEALESGRLRNYVTDFPHSGVVGKDKVIILPHLGASTDEAEDNCAKMAVHQVMEYMENGNLINSCNYPSVNMGRKNGKRICILAKADDTLLKAVTEAVNVKKIASESNDKYSYTIVETDEVPASLSIANDSVIRIRVIE